MRRTVVGLLVVGVWLLAACDSDGSAKRADGNASTTVAPTSSTAGGTTTIVDQRVALEGPTWQLVSMAGKAIPRRVTVTATFKAGTISGSSGCNAYSATYTVNGSRMTVSKRMGTLMACPDGMAVERAYLAALAKVERYEITKDGSLELATSDAQVIAFTETPQQIVGSWHVTGYLKPGAAAFTSVLAGTTVTARFDSTGRVSGSNGCNTYVGPYTVTGTKIYIGELGGTLKLCSEPDGVDQQATDFLFALQSAQTFAVPGNELTLFNGQKQRVVTMTRTPTS